MRFLLRNRLVPLQILVGLLLMLGVIPGPSEGVKCYSCEGPDCGQPADSATKECEANEGACFKSGAEGSMKRGCYSTAKADCIKKTVAGGDCYDPVQNKDLAEALGKCVESSKKEGETSDLPPPAQGQTCVCTGDLCNKGPASATPGGDGRQGGGLECYTCNGGVGSDCSSSKKKKLKPFAMPCPEKASGGCFETDRGKGVSRGCSPLSRECLRRVLNSNCIRKNDAGDPIKLLSIGECLGLKKPGSRDHEVTAESRQLPGGLDSLTELFKGDFQSVCICDKNLCNRSPIAEADTTGKLTYNMGLILAVSLSLITRDILNPFREH